MADPSRVCPNLHPANGAWRCAIRKAPRQPTLPNPPKWAKLRPGGSLTLDKSWGQRQGEKGGPDDQRGRLIGRKKGGLNTKLHAVADAKGRPLRFFMTAGQVSDYTGAAALLGSLPAAQWLIADRAYRASERHRFKRTGEGRLVPGSFERQRDTSMYPPVGSPAARPSDTTSDAIAAATGSRSRSAG